MKNFDFRIYQRANGLEILPLTEKAINALEMRRARQPLGFWAVDTTPIELAILRAAGFTFC